MYLQFLLALFMSRYHMGATESFERPHELALFLDRIGRVHHLNAITIVRSLGSVDPSYLDALHRGLTCNSSNHFSLLPQMTATDKVSTHVRFSSLQDEKAIYLVFARDSKDMVVHLHAVRARGRRYAKTMFLLRRQESQEDIKYFFDHLWKLQFRSALVVVAAKTVYQMDPYPTVRVIRMRRLSFYDPHHIFPPANRRNFRGYRLRMPVQQDVPNTFWYKSLRTSEWELSGLGGILINHLMKHLNVTMDLFSFEVNGSTLLNMAALTDLIVEGKAELSPHLYDTLQPNTNVDYSYPTQVARRCFMIPLDNEISRSLYVFLPFSLPLWLCLLVALLVVHFVYVRRLMPDGHFWAILGVPGADPVRYGSRKPGRAFCTFLILGGIFILAQTYSTKLTSSLTVTLTRRPVDSLDELFLLPYRILVMPEDVYAIVGSLGHAEQFSTKFSLTDAESFSEKRICMNPDYIYPISTTRWRFFDLQQRFLRKKRFYFSTICHGSYPYQYQLSVDSHLKDALHQFLLHVQQAGLHDLWLESCYRMAHRMGYLKDFSTLAELEEKLRLRPLALNLLVPAFSLFLCGLLGSGIAFLVEIRHSFGCRQKPPPINRNPGD
ncbi:uncharacterized protein LOC122615650 [Drosophila teissieri]|uniref:uncharacterized protein LOC122615650 n=1 Tax=Drosophila teissieri TaxID=7243 RepID=UPI001CBA404C|nr:uncharacterized protein LOC122615650 [Drosophila teissieri]